ncbi:MAG: SprT-like family protein [Lachnospiraceae bacterium]|nr:SprT-like domain-containing protein [uncultured Acetatifactor sp.]MCI8286458.1 SprT-like family protein [Lachnospiraceae bacterium]
MLKNMQEVLEYGFEVLNAVYFENALPPVVITIMSSPRTYGHFTIGKVWKAEEEHLNEINISAEHLSRKIENIMATLQHELIHYFCQIQGIADTSQNGRYHNKNFKREAEARGLIISYAKYIGYSVTEPTPEFIEVLQIHGIEKPLEINRDGIMMITGIGGNGSGGDDGKGGADGTGGRTGKRKTSTRKFQCPCCGNSFRATKDIRVLCMDCNEQFVKVEK